MFSVSKKTWVLHTKPMDPYDPAFKKLVDFIKELPGFLAAHPNNEGMLWAFDSKDNAKNAQEKLKEYGANPSRNVVRSIYTGKTLMLECIDN